MTEKQKPMISLKNFFVKFASIVDAGDNPEAKIPLFKSAEDKKDNKGGGKSMTLKEILKSMDDEQKKVVEDELQSLKEKVSGFEKDKEDFETAKEELEKKIEELEKEDEPEIDNDEDLVKSADPKIQELIKNMEKEQEKIKKDLDEKVEKEKVEKAKLRKEEIKKEVDDFTNIGASNEELVDVFSKIDETGDSELYDKVKTILKASDEALKSSDIMVQVGTTQEGVQKSAAEELDEKAKELVEKDGITIEKARAKIIKSDPDKYMV